MIPQTKHNLLPIFTHVGPISAVGKTTTCQLLTFTQSHTLKQGRGYYMGPLIGCWYVGQFS